MSDSEIELLQEEFPELTGVDIVLNKEIYAHFGLAFMKFGLVEHSLINVLVFSHVGENFISGKIRSKQEWERAFDVAHADATKLTFGQLINSVQKIAEFEPLVAKLRDLKTLRNYFAHRFMRDEAQFQSSDEGCWLLLTKIASVRRKAMTMEDEIRPPFECMCARLNIRLPGREETDSDINRLLDDSRVKIQAGTAKVGWE
jgi:hypothetical protein